MIGWESVHARDAAEAIERGACDADLGGLMNAIQRRVKVRDGVPVCPICGELMEAPSGRYKTVSHEHDGFTITREIKPSTRVTATSEEPTAERFGHQGIEAM